MTSDIATIDAPAPATDLVTLWNKLFKTLDRVQRDRDDPEAVHDARVASRRVRTAMGAAAPSHSRKWFRSLNADAKSITRSLGRLRDVDVMLGQAITSLENADDQAAPGWRYLSRQLGRERRRERKDVVRRLNRFDAGYRKQAIKRLSNATSADGHPSQPSNPDASYLARRTADVLAFDPEIRSATDPARFHALRIKTKHLRYALELASPAPDPRLLDALKRLQESLGNLHDCDVRVERLGHEAASLGARRNADQQIVASLAHLAKEEAIVRDHLRTEALAAWAKLRRGNLRKQLDALAELPAPSMVTSDGHAPLPNSVSSATLHAVPA
jgi:CHAD domain-containing protein